MKALFFHYLLITRRRENKLIYKNVFILINMTENDKGISESGIVTNEYLALFSEQCQDYDQVIHYIEEIVKETKNKSELSETSSHLLTLAYRTIFRKKIREYRLLEQKIVEENIALLKNKELYYTNGISGNLEF